MRHDKDLRYYPSSMRHDLFSTPVWHLEGTPQELVDELYKGAYRFKKEHPSYEVTNYGGYQSPPFTLEKFHPQGIEYIKAIVTQLFAKEDSTSAPLTAIEFPPICDFKVESWWYNINGQGHWNTPHTHPNSDFALVLYLTDSDSLLTFLNPHAQRTISQQNSSINAKKGDIVIFPSDLVHYVMPNQREEDRISISMNLQLC